MTLLKEQLTSLVSQHGARRVAEELVEVFHDHAGDSAKDDRNNVQLQWLRIAVNIGRAVHWQNLEWPS